MLLSHLGKSPTLHPDAYVAPNATICGDVRLGAGVRVMFGACIVAEDSPVTIGERGIVMENAVVRSMGAHATTLGASCLVGPHAHIVGATLEDDVFVATGASVFHGARLGRGTEVRIRGVVHIRTVLPAHSVVPIGWIAVGIPPRILPPEHHEAIWEAQKPLEFPRFVYGVERAPEGESAMHEITRRRSEALGRHRGDEPVDRS